MKGALQPLRHAGLMCLLAALGCLTATCAVSSAFADTEPPVAWQPTDASSAEGAGFAVTMRASPTDVAAEGPITLTIRVQATGAWQRPPHRPSIASLKTFKGFEIAPSNSAGPDRSDAAGGWWEFDYRLRPRMAAVTKIPGIAFHYYNAQVPVAERRWQTTFADPIALTVRPRPALTARDVQGQTPPAKLPAVIYAFAHGPGVLVPEQPFSLPGPFAIALLLLIPPAVCVGGGFLWCCRHPGSLGRRQNSRAAQQALKALDSLGADEEQPIRAAAIVSAYLRERMETPPGALMPGEVAETLQKAGYEPALAAKGADFFRACEHARFAPDRNGAAHTLQSAAANLIRSVEEECP